MSTYRIPLNQHASGEATAFVLTTDRLYSPFGRPVCLVEGGHLDGNAYGPEDFMPLIPAGDVLEFLNEMQVARVSVLCAAREAQITKPWPKLLTDFVGDGKWKVAI